MRRQLAAQRQAQEAQQAEQSASLAEQQAQQAQQQAQQAEQYAQQLERLDRLKKQLEEDHAEQQLTMRENAAHIRGPEECYNAVCTGRACSTSDEV